MSNVEPYRSPTSSVQNRTSATYGRVPRFTSRALGSLDHRTSLRLATVQAEGLIQSQKLQEIDHLARVAMTGQGMLRRWADTLAGADPFLADELRFFTDVARMGKGEIIADTIDMYCRESRS